MIIERKIDQNLIILIQTVDATMVLMLMLLLLLLLFFLLSLLFYVLLCACVPACGSIIDQDEKLKQEKLGQFSSYRIKTGQWVH